MLESVERVSLRKVVKSESWEEGEGLWCAR